MDHLSCNGYNIILMGNCTKTVQQLKLVVLCQGQAYIEIVWQHSFDKTKTKLAYHHKSHVKQNKTNWNCLSSSHHKLWFRRKPKVTVLDVKTFWIYSLFYTCCLCDAQLPSCSSSITFSIFNYFYVYFVLTFIFQVQFSFN